MFQVRGPLRPLRLALSLLCISGSGPSPWLILELSSSVSPWWGAFVFKLQSEDLQLHLFLWPSLFWHMPLTPVSSLASLAASPVPESLLQTTCCLFWLSMTLDTCPVKGHSKMSQGRADSRSLSPAILCLLRFLLVPLPVILLSLNPSPYSILMEVSDNLNHKLKVPTWRILCINDCFLYLLLLSYN